MFTLHAILYYICNLPCHRGWSIIYCITLNSLCMSPCALVYTPSSHQAFSFMNVLHESAISYTVSHIYNSLKTNYKNVTIVYYVLLLFVGGGLWRAHCWNWPLVVYLLLLFHLFLISLFAVFLYFSIGNRSFWFTSCICYTLILSVNFCFVYSAFIFPIGV